MKVQMENMYTFIDTETYSLDTFPITVQYTQTTELNIDTEIKVFHIWYETGNDFLKLVESFLDTTVVAFNLTFDWFMLTKLYNAVRDLDDLDRMDILMDHFDEINREHRIKWFLKPKSQIDIMLHLSKGPFQHLKERKRPVLYRIPVVAVSTLLPILNAEFASLDDALFAGRKKEQDLWKVTQPDDESPDFVNIYLAWKPSMALKSIIRSKYPKLYNAEEINQTVFTKSNAQYMHWRVKMKKDLLLHYASYWLEDLDGEEYAKNDVKYLIQLMLDYDMTPDYDDSLAIMNASVFTHGFALDREKLKLSVAKYYKQSRLAPTAPSQVLPLLKKVCENPLTEAMIESTDVKTLDGLIEMREEEPQLAEIAHLVKESRRGANRLNIMNKLTEAGRFYPMFRVCGTLTNRMSGSGKLNPQGIAREDSIRSLFLFIDDEDRANGYSLSGGDFDGFEIAIAQAVHKDVQLDEDLKSGYKIHAFMSSKAFDMTYEEVLATKGTTEDKYVLGKNGVFAMFYGGNAYTLTNRMVIKDSKAKKIEKDFQARYKGFAKNRAEIFEDFTTGEDRPKFRRNHAASMLGHTRYFKLEQDLLDRMRYVLEICQKTDWANITLVRNESKGRQTVGEIITSVIWGFFYSMQSRCGRQAVNHEVQSTGAELTKILQIRIWDLQPQGVSAPVVLPFNVHDELIVMNKFPDKVADVVSDFIEEYKAIVPHLGMTWNKELKNWSEKV